jgi:hypothetical protein
MSSMYQLHGISTSVEGVGLAGAAAVWGLKSMGLMAGGEGRKYGAESWWLKEVSIRDEHAGWTL